MEKKVMFAGVDLKSVIRQEFSAPLIIAIVIYAAYSAVITSTFGVMDDYCFLFTAMEGKQDTISLLISAGRPINALLIDSGFRYAGSIENLALLRTITLFGIWLLACIIYLFARLNLVGYISSLALACGIILLPSFQVYASWAQHFTTPFAGAISLLSAFVLTPACSIRQRSRLTAILLSSILLLTAITIYQPIAMLFCTGLLISIMAGSGENSWDTKRVQDAVMTYVTAMSSSFMVLKIGLHFYPGDPSRTGLAKDIPGKITWFIKEPLSNALAMFSVPFNSRAFMLVVFIIMLGAFFLIRRRKLSTVCRPSLYGFFCLLGSYAPNLATAENWASYRSIGALTATVLVLFVFMVNEIVGYVQIKFTTNILVDKLTRNFWLVPTIMLIILIGRAQSHILNGFVIPNVTELNNLASVLQEENSRGASRVTVMVKPSSWLDSAARPIAYDEFGIPSSHRVYYANAMVGVVLRSMNLLPESVIETYDENQGEPLTGNAQSFLVDFPQLLTNRRFRTAPQIWSLLGNK